MNKMTRRAVIGGAATALALGAVVFSTAAQSTLERIKSEGKITVGIHNRAPWGFRGENGEVAGFSPDLVRAAFEPIGVTEIDFVISDFGALIPGLTSRRFDAVASGLYITPVRCEAVAFSDPDLSLKDAVLVKEGNPFDIHSYEDIAANTEVRFGVTRGSANAANAAEARVPEDRTMMLQDTESTVAALLGGRVDAISFSAPTAISVLQDPKITGIERAEPFTGVIQENGREKSGYSAIAFHPQDTDLRDAYNARLAEMKADGTVADIMKKYGFAESETAPDLTQEQICSGNG
ncbi:ectoine/hydroxyectoine ABC transporter substrate-binding protein EhuB [Chelativorans xinjiangense]|uniref:ectoine/hydroxyectoine ABC transporter substrate-binding protein EhuB n=1 Tax=Chelativorans xinjiangense TaxID=2681485 RepID=UPI0013583CE9|nr:ectoine/hydroxyectoine ABC transporter substrate-binding protein EhuB [Chelativorans xinjiangense]